MTPPLSMVWLYPSRLYIQILAPERWSEIGKGGGRGSDCDLQPHAHLPQPGWPLCPRSLMKGHNLHSFQGMSVLIFHAPCLLTDLANRDEVWVLALRVPRSFWRHYSLEDPAYSAVFSSCLYHHLRYYLFISIDSLSCLPPHPEQEVHEGGTWFWLWSYRSS